MPAGLTVRRAERRDIPILAELDLVLPQHQGLSPVFSAGEVPTLEEALADWEESIDDREYATFVAERNGDGDRVLDRLLDREVQRTQRTGTAGQRWVPWVRGCVS